MKIARVETFVLKVRIGDARFYSSQAEFPERNSLLVRVTSSDGAVGWGEGGQYGPPEPVKAAIDDVLAPLLLALEDASPAIAWDAAYGRTRDFGQKGTYVEAISALDIALWDLWGQALGEPVSTLLGGRFRARVKAYGTGGYYAAPEFNADRDLPALAAAVAGYAESGFEILKLKVGLLPVADDAERMRVARETLGDEFVLLADANHAFNANVALALGRVLDDLGFRMFEEPVPPEDRTGYAWLRSRLDVPIAGGETEFTRYGFRDLFEAGCVDIAQPDVCVCGGLSEFQRIATLASTRNVRVIPHVWGSGIALSAALHACATLPLTPYAYRPVPLQNEPVIEFDRTPNPLRDDLLIEPFDLRDGYLDVPAGPGLGITVDPDVLERYAVG